MLAATPALAAEKTVSGDVTYTNASEFNNTTEYYIKAGASDKTVTFGRSYLTNRSSEMNYYHLYGAIQIVSRSLARIW